MNKAIDAIGRLEHLANKSAYEYTAEQVEVMFGALESRVADVKAKLIQRNRIIHLFLLEHTQSREENRNEILI